MQDSTEGFGPSHVEDDDRYADEVVDGEVAEGPDDAVSGAVAAANGSAGPDTNPAIIDRLRRAYAAGQAERTETFPIAPGRYRDLAAVYRPIDWDYRRKLMKRAERTGNYGTEANLDFQAALVADACVELVMRPEPGAEYVGLHTLVESMRSGGAIRYDHRLATVLGMSLVGGETEGDIVRLVFGEEGAFEVHMTTLTQWSTQITGGDDEDDEDDGGGDERPT